MGDGAPVAAETFTGKSTHNLSVRERERERQRQRERHRERERERERKRGGCLRTLCFNLYELLTFVLSNFANLHSNPTICRPVHF